MKVSTSKTMKINSNSIDSLASRLSQPDTIQKYHKNEAKLAKGSTIQLPVAICLHFNITILFFILCFSKRLV